MANAKRDENRVTTLLGVSSIDLSTPTTIAANPSTHAILIDGTSLYTGLDTRYLKLDTSNDPLTGNLLLTPTSNSTTVFQITKQDGTTQVFDVDTTNARVGIGTSAPGYQLDTSYSSSSTAVTTGTTLMAVSNTDTTTNNTSAMGFGAKAAADGLIYTSSKLVGIHTNHTFGSISGDLAVVTRNAGTFGEVARFMAGGSVGISNTGPSSKLEVTGLPGVTIDKVALNASSTASAPTTISMANSYLQVGGQEYNTNSYRIISFGYTGSTLTNFPAFIGFQETSSSTNTKGDLIFGTRNVVTDTAPSERMRIDSAGKVGIGTTSPTNILSLGNSAAQKFWIENSATDVIGRALTIAGGGTVAGTSVSDVAGGNLILQAGLGTGTGASSILFQTGTTLGTGLTLQTMSTKLTLTGNGAFGVGTDTTYRFTVSGTAIGTVYVGAVGGANAVSGDIFYWASSSAVTGSLSLFDSSLNATQEVAFRLQNLNTANSTARANLNITTGGASAGDPTVIYAINGVTNWIHGIDNSASDAFIISSSSGLGTSDRIVVTTTGRVGINGAPATNILLLSNSVSLTGSDPIVLNIATFAIPTAGTGGTLLAVNGRVYANNGETIPTAYGINIANVRDNAGSTITNTYLFRMSNPTTDGTRTNMYGIYVPTLSGAGTDVGGIFVQGATGGTSNTLLGLGISIGVAGSWGIYNASANPNVHLGKSSFGMVTAPVALVNIAAGTATANTAPLKLTSGTILTTAEAGVHEYNGNHYLSNSSLRFPVGGTLFDHFADVGNVGTGEDDLYSDTLAASTLVNNGDKVTATYAGLFVGAAAATQDLRVYFGGTKIYDSGALSIGVATDNWIVNVTCIRVSSSIVRCGVSLSTDFGTLFPYATYTAVTGLTLTNTQILKITGEAAGVGAADNQIVAKLGYVEFKPAS